MRLLAFGIVFVLLDLACAEVYLSYTNNTGTYTSRYPNNPSENIELEINEEAGNSKTSHDNNLQTVQNKSTVFDIPVSINTLNVNNHSGLKNIQKAQTTGYTFKGNKCTSCGEQNESSNNNSNSGPTLRSVYSSINSDLSEEDIIDQSENCCYISLPRNCTVQNGLHICKTKVIAACGDRCKNPEKNEEVYYQNKLDTPSYSPMNRVTHPYAKVPYHAKAYPGSRYPIGRNPSLHFRPRYRPSYYEQDSYDNANFEEDRFYPNPRRWRGHPTNNYRSPGRPPYYRNRPADFGAQEPSFFYRNRHYRPFYGNNNFNDYENSEYSRQDYANHNPYRQSRRRYNSHYAPRYLYKKK